MAFELESTAVFNQRLTSIGLGAIADRFTEMGWDNHGSFAFACSVPPGTAGHAPALDAEVIGPMCGEAGGVYTARIRRLACESYTMTMADQNRRIMQTANEPERPHVVPSAEKALRLEQVKQYMGRMVIKDDLEPSDLLVDRFAGMQDSGVLRFVPWAELGRRDHEVRGIKKETAFVPNAAGMLCQVTTQQ